MPPPTYCVKVYSVHFAQDHCIRRVVSLLIGCVSIPASCSIQCSKRLCQAAGHQSLTCDIFGMIHLQTSYANALFVLWAPQLYGVTRVMLKFKTVWEHSMDYMLSVYTRACIQMHSRRDTITAGYNWIALPNDCSTLPVHFDFRPFQHSVQRTRYCETSLR
jgi:hypothetical protein